VLEDYFGKKRYVPKVANQMTPKVLMVKTEISFNSNPMIPWANKVNELVRKPEYFYTVTSLAESAASQGHKVLVVSDRTDFLEKCHAKHIDSSVLVHGKVPQDERDKRHKLLEKDKNILYGAISMYKEGISINCLSCLILAAPINNDPMLEQLIGRILRIQDNKVQPLVVDLVLKGSTGKTQAAMRAKHYSKKKYKVYLTENVKIVS
jgi:superfamily II DNA or RNA helicase